MEVVSRIFSDISGAFQQRFKTFGLRAINLHNVGITNY
jgi:hypothetical protein